MSNVSDNAISGSGSKWKQVEKSRAMMNRI